MTKNRYFIEFDNLETEMSTCIRISLDEFTTNLKFLHNKVKETQDAEYPLQHINTYYDDTEQCMRTRHVFGCGTATTRLIQITCKDGFRFKNKGE